MKIITRFSVKLAKELENCNSCSCDISPAVLLVTDDSVSSTHLLRRSLLGQCTPPGWTAEYDLMLFLVTGACLDLLLHSPCTAEVLMPSFKGTFPLSFALFIYKGHGVSIFFQSMGKSSRQPWVCTSSPLLQCFRMSRRCNETSNAKETQALILGRGSSGS